MQFSNFTRIEEDLTITFYNEMPIENVGNIKHFTHNLTGLFEKQEVRWSFNNGYWSAWEKLTQNALTVININKNYYLFLQIRYVKKSINSGNVTSFVVTYTKGTTVPPANKFEITNIPAPRVIPTPVVTVIPKVDTPTQFSNFSKLEEDLTIIVYNTIPIENVGKIKYFKESLTNSSDFSKKEFRWSFNDEYWSAWENLTQNGMSIIDTYNNYYLFLQIRYTQKVKNIGKFNSLVVNYTLGSALPITPRIIMGDNQISSTPNDLLIHDIIQEYSIIPVIDASYLNGYPGSWYLNRSRQSGYQPISSITNLQQILNGLNQYDYAQDVSISWLFDQKYLRESSLNLSSGFSWGVNGLLYVDVSVIAGGVTRMYVDGSLAERDASISILTSLIENIADASGTTYESFQLRMNDNGVILKDVSGNLEVISPIDGSYSGVKAGSFNVGTTSGLYLLNLKEEVIESLLNSYYVIDTSWGFEGTYSTPPISGLAIVNDASVYANGNKYLYKVGNTWFLQRIESPLVANQSQSWNGPFWFNEGGVIGAYFGNSTYYGQTLTIYNYQDLYPEVVGRFRRSLGIQGNADIIGNLGVHGKIITEQLKLDPSFNGVLITKNGEVTVSSYKESRNFETTISYSGSNTFIIDHSLNTLNQLIAVYDPLTQEEIFPQKTRGPNSSRLDFYEFPIDKTYHVIIIGY